MRRLTATTAPPLSLAERKASVAKIAAEASPNVRAVLERIDFRELTAQEREFAETLVPKAREILARGSREAA
jgi:hypothetical protein